MVAIFRSLRGESLEDYSIRLAQAWRVGQKGLENGVIFLVFLDDRRMRIEIGYGLEDRLTDAQAGAIIRDVVAPRFREGRIADGVAAGVDAIAAAIAGTYAGPAKRTGAPPPLLLVGIGLMLLAGIPLLLISLAQARQRQHGLTGDRGGWTMRPPTTFGWPPLGGGSWGSSGGTDDSFTPGGGRFGGGGASGSW